jgi:acyl dehydratase
MQLNELTGTDLGASEISYHVKDAILYALAVGAEARHLDLVYERDLRVLPTFACALGLWAVERAGDLGAYDRKQSLHVSQALVMHRKLPPEARIPTRGRIAAVWDKGRATTVDIEVTSDVFTATYTIYLPGIGGWGGEPGPKSSAEAIDANRMTWRGEHSTSRNLAALYRLTGDLHPIHIDPHVAAQNGFERPILHGLCTLGIAAREVAAANGSHPADLSMISARLSAPVMPGDAITVLATEAHSAISFEGRVGDRAVLKAGHAVFTRAA